MTLKAWASWHVAWRAARVKSVFRYTVQPQTERASSWQPYVAAERSVPHSQDTVHSRNRLLSFLACCLQARAAMILLPRTNCSF